MDKALFVGMGGQRNAMKELEILSNNLANVNTPGFRADYETTKSFYQKQEGLETRVYPQLGKTYSDFKQGPVLSTGRDLDVAIFGKGMFAVQSNTGQEGYTRAGNFEVSADGFLTTARGEVVIGDGGVIKIPESERIEIGKDGTISVRPLGEKDMIAVAKLKVIMPEYSNMEKQQDGLFYPKDGKKYQSDLNAKVASGSLEGSNVNPIDTLVKLIDLSRRYEIHSNVIKNLSEDAVGANKLLDMKS